MKEKFRKLFIDFLIRYGKDSCLSNELQLLKDFDKLWNDEYSTDPSKFLSFCNTLLYYHQEMNNKTNVIKFRIYSVIRWLFKNGLKIPTERLIKTEFDLNELNQSIDNICYKLNHKEEIYDYDIVKFFNSFSEEISVEDIRKIYFV